MPESPLLDQLMANAWRPRIQEVHGAWRLRWADGVTRRANSALALDRGHADAHADAGIGSDGPRVDLDLPHLIDLAERFYARHRAPTRLQVSTASPPAGLVEELDRRNYRRSARTSVETATTSAVVERTRHTGGLAIEITPAPTDDWFQSYWSIEAGHGRSTTDADTCRHSLLAPDLPMAFATARRGDEVVGVGQIVIEHGWAGLQCMATEPTHRRRGTAHAVLHALARQATIHGAGHMYLAVLADNEPARRLYASAGFTTAHEYSYFTEAQE